MENPNNTSDNSQELPVKIGENALLPCISIFYTPGKLGLRNNCDRCKKAVVNWSPSNTGRYSVPAYSEKIIPLEDTFGTLIGEEPC